MNKPITANNNNNNGATRTNTTTLNNNTIMNDIIRRLRYNNKVDNTIKTTTTTTNTMMIASSAIHHHHHDDNNVDDRTNHHLPGWRPRCSRIINRYRYNNDKQKNDNTKTSTTNTNHHHHQKNILFNNNKKTGQQQASSSLSSSSATIATIKANNSSVSNNKNKKNINNNTIIEDLISRLRCNDKETTIIHLDRTNLGWGSSDHDDNDNNDHEKKNHQLFQYCYYLGRLTQAIRYNSIVHTVILNSNIISNNTSNNNIMTNKAIGQLFIAICQLPTLRNLDIYWDRNHNGLQVSWLSNALLEHTSLLQLERLGIYNAKLIATGNSPQDDYQHFYDALLTLSCTTLKKLICFQLQFPHSQSSSSSSPSSSTITFGIEELILNCIAKLPSKSSLQDIQITQSLAGIGCCTTTAIPTTATRATTNSSKSNNSNKNSKKKKGGAVAKAVAVRISEQAIQSLCKVQNLQRLTLSGFQLDTNNVTGIVAKLKNPNDSSKLQFLNLSSNNLKDDGCVVLMNALLNSLITSSSTRTTNQKRNNSCSSSVPISSSSSSLQELVLMNNKLGYKAAMSIAAVLQHENCSIYYLNLSNNNKFGDKGIQILSDALLNNTTITKLHLSDCHIGNNGIESITNVIQNQRIPTIQELNIKYNSTYTKQRKNKPLQNSPPLKMITKVSEEEEKQQQHDYDDGRYCYHHLKLAIKANHTLTRVVMDDHNDFNDNHNDHKNYPHFVPKQQHLQHHHQVVEVKNHCVDDDNTIEVCPTTTEEEQINNNSNYIGCLQHHSSPTSRAFSEKFLLSKINFTILH